MALSICLLVKRSLFQTFLHFVCSPRRTSYATILRTQALLMIDFCVTIRQLHCDCSKESLFAFHRAVLFEFIAFVFSVSFSRFRNWGFDRNSEARSRKYLWSVNTILAILQNRMSYAESCNFEYNVANQRISSPGCIVVTVLTDKH